MSGSPERTFTPGNLVIYKTSPARVVSPGAKIEIELPGKPNLMVRSKDIFLLHPGPVSSLNLPDPPPSEIREAWEILQGETTTLGEFAELVYGEFSPSTAWAAYGLLRDGLFIRGTPDEVHVLSREEHEAEESSREERNRETGERFELLERVRRGEVSPEDRKSLREVEEVANGRSPSSRILKELGITNSPQSAHSLLLKLGIWDETVNPYIRRFAFSDEIVHPPLEEFPDEERLDLTGLASFAIDDEGNEDPDDAVSLDGDRLWVHVSDPASIIRPDSPADIIARIQGANLYLPEKKVPMLPPEATGLFGLGIKETSPALSFGIRLGADGSPADFIIRLSRVKVTRLSYLRAQEMLSESPLRDILSLTRRFNDHRKKNGAIFIRLPEVRIRVTEGRVSIRPLPETESQTMVTDAMLLAGQAAARFALANGIPMPYASQEPPDNPCEPGDYAAMYACRKTLRASSVRSSPSPHAGLGLDVYSRATSPLRRYLDLVAHQQIRGFLTGGRVLDADEMTERIGAVESVTGAVQKLERQSNLHWTLVYLGQNPDLELRGIIVEKRGRTCTVLIPDIALETKLNTSRDIALNDEVRLRPAGIDLPNLTAHFEAL